MWNRMLGFAFQYHNFPDLTALKNTRMQLLVAGKNRKKAKEIAKNF
jgi:lipoprotein-releasing system ATP-binding protein